MQRFHYGPADRADIETCGSVAFIARPVVSLLRSNGSIGKVHSTFPDLVNVVTPRGRFIAIHGDAVGRTPMSLGVDSQGEHAFLNANRTGFVIRDGEELFQTNECLTLGDFCWAYNPPLTPVWDASVCLEEPGRRTAGRVLPTVRQAYRNGWRAGLQDGFAAMADSSTRSGRLARALTESFVQAWFHVLRSLGPANDQRESDDLVRALTSLIGLGPGLTPSGDDFVIGWTASVHLLGKRGKDILACHRQTIEAICRERTHDLSAEYISYALSGEWTEHVGRLLKACQRLGCAPSRGIGEERANVAGTAQNVIAVGATSGMDMMLGFMRGLEVIDTIERLSEQGT